MNRARLIIASNEEIFWNSFVYAHTRNLRGRRYHCPGKKTKIQSGPRLHLDQEPCVTQ